MNYLDMSVLVAAVSAETASDRVHYWIARQEPESLCISNWGQTEFSAALSMMVRLGLLSEERRVLKLRDFTVLCEEDLVVIATEAPHFAGGAKIGRSASSSASRRRRTALAIAGEQGASLVSLDKRLIDASRNTGVSATLV